MTRRLRRSSMPVRPRLPITPIGAAANMAYVRLQKGQGLPQRLTPRRRVPFSLRPKVLRKRFGPVIRLQQPGGRGLPGMVFSPRGMRKH